MTRSRKTITPAPALTHPFEANGRHWKTELTAVPSAGGYASFRQLRLARKTDAEFVLAPSLGARAFGLLFLCFGTGILCAYANMLTGAKWFKPPVDFKEWAQLVLGLGFGAFLGLMCVGFSLRMLTLTIRFDKRTGTITRAWLLRTSEVRSVEEVVAVQCLSLGKVTIGGGRGGSTTVDMYQVNLVLEFPPAFRVNLCTEPNERFCRDTAWELAKFLGVPLLEATAMK